MQRFHREKRSSERFFFFQQTRLPSMKTLLTGGAGYIGSHTAVELLRQGHDVVIYDNLFNSQPEAIRRIEQISGRSVPFIEADVRDQSALEKALSQHHIDSVVHFAGKKAVGESVAQPVDYYDNNVNGSLVLLRAMQAQNVHKLVFSSSATVYGVPQYLPYDEAHPTAAMNPIGAHPSGLIGEDPSDIPNNLLPYIAQVAVGRRNQLQIFGGDYETPDGTGVRDYIHVVDLARGHVKALEKLQNANQTGVMTVNLGTGKGFSVLDVLHAFEKACGKPIPYAITDRRPGDLPSYYANPANALSTLGWQAQHSLDEMCADTWRWQSQNPNGYRQS